MMEGFGLTLFAAPLAAFFVAAASPGPATLAVAATAMSAGRRAALSLGAGLAVGLGLWGVVAGAGLGALLLHSASAMTVLRICGAIYLLWLAWCSARAAFGPDAQPAQGAAPHGRVMFWRGLLLNASNPKAVLAWLAVLAIGLPEGAGITLVWTTVAACAVLGLGIYVALALAFSRPAIQAGYARGRRWIEAGVALAFGAAAVRLLSGRSGEASP